MGDLLRAHPLQRPKKFMVDRRCVDTHMNVQVCGPGIWGAKGGK